MSTNVDRTDIGKAFYRFEILQLGEKKDNIFDDGKAENRKNAKTELRKAQIEEWYDLFNVLEISVFESAVDSAVKTCKFWPSLAQMLEFVDEAQRRYDEKIRQEIKDREAKQEHAHTIKINTKTLLADMRAGRIMKPDNLVNTDVVALARKYFPEMSMERIEENAVVLSSIVAERCECSKCMNRKYCKRGGYRGVPKVDVRTGYVQIYMERCPIGTAKESIS